MRAIQDYIPEQLHLALKREVHSRICHEDCAVLDPDTLCVLASRGETYPIGAPLENCVGLSAAELAFLHKSLPFRRRILLRGKKPTLVFFERSAGVGILLVITPSAKEETLLRASAQLADRELLVSPFFAPLHRTALKAEDGEICQLLSEWLFYTDGIFSCRTTQSILPATHLIANFAGCRLTGEIVLPAELQIGGRERMRLILFLFCCFLSLRRMLGSVRMASDVCDGVESSRLHLMLTLQDLTQEEIESREVLFSTRARKRVEQTRRTALEGDLFSFLSFPAFWDFGIKQGGGDTVLEVTLDLLEKDVQAVHAVEAARSRLCLSFHIA